jgi:hypothetical protein
MPCSHSESADSYVAQITVQIRDIPYMRISALLILAH